CRTVRREAWKRSQLKRSFGTPRVLDRANGFTRESLGPLSALAVASTGEISDLSVSHGALEALRVDCLRHFRTSIVDCQLSRMTPQNYPARRDSPEACSIQFSYCTRPYHSGSLIPRGSTVGFIPLVVRRESPHSHSRKPSRSIHSCS